MKKILTIFLSSMFVLVLAACGGDDSEDTSNSSSESNDNTEESEADSSGGDYHEGQVEIGETANVRTFPSEKIVEVTVNDMNLATEVEGNSIEEYIVNAVPEARLLVVDMTIKNTSDEAITPAGELPTTRQEDDRGNDGAKMEFFPEFEQPIEPGEEVSGTLFFTSTTSNSYDVVSMNINDGVDGHVYWEIPGINAE